MNIRLFVSKDAQAVSIPITKGEPDHEAEQADGQNLGLPF